MTDLNSVTNAGFQGTNLTDTGKSLKQKTFINKQQAKDSFMSSLKEKIKTNKKGLIIGAAAALGIAGGIVYAVKTGKLQELIANIKGNKPAEEKSKEPTPELTEKPVPEPSVDDDCPEPDPEPDKLDEDEPWDSDDDDDTDTDTDTDIDCDTDIDDYYDFPEEEEPEDD